MNADLLSEYRPQAEKTRFDKLLQAFAQSKPGSRLFLTILPAIDRRLIPLSCGKLSTGAGQPVILLHTRGARSGIGAIDAAARHEDRRLPMRARITRGRRT
jgi:hypothetical protein